LPSSLEFIILKPFNLPVSDFGTLYTFPGYIIISNTHPFFKVSERFSQ